MEKIMVAIGINPDSEKLILKARQLASACNAEWFAVSIDMGNKLDNTNRVFLNDNLNLARKLGAKVISIIDTDVVTGIMKFAVENNISKILIGKTHENKFLSFLNKESIVSRLIRKCRNIDVIVIDTSNPVKKTSAREQKVNRTTKPFEYLIAFISVIIIAALCFPVSTTIGYQTVGLIFLMSVAVLSLFIGRGAVLLAAILNFVIWNYFFIPPLFTFHVDNIHDLITLFANLVVAVVGGALITRIRKNQITLIKSQERISLLYSLLESLNDSTSVNDVVTKAQQELKKHFSAEAVLYLKEKNKNKLSPKILGNAELHTEEGFLLAQQLFEKQEPGKQTISGIHYELLALPHSIIGIIGLRFKNEISSEQDKPNLLKSFIVQIASMLDREINIDIAKENQIYMESQKLFQTVLNSVSHELKTPIAIITAAVANLYDEKTAANPELRRQICEELNSAAKRLNVLVDHILDMSKLESGYLKLNLQMCDVGDLVGVAMNELKNEMQNHKISVNIQENLPLLKVDISLFKQALINILHNAIVYTPPGGEICVNVYLRDDKLIIFELSDTGLGVPEESLLKLFEKFYRVPGSKSGGTGLGLAIAKAIIETHKGTIFAKNRENGGLSVLIILNA